MDYTDSDGNAIEHGLDSGYGIDKVKFTSVGTGAAGYNVDTEYFVTNNFSNGATNASTEKGLALSTVQNGTPKMVSVIAAELGYYK